ncbi:MAG: hypothetical protein COA71_04175 [SAR86 cluster bacterium]|uniref:PepSY domain-containing protein n=1 Tax=SAR86 cluster bacterium TaxID=2030880 RepID=A0A2A5CGP4_9GAMM|nr:MAG: hypothetical protein COA71_04175 [SAR86 cluster bacterium]
MAALVFSPLAVAQAPRGGPDGAQPQPPGQPGPGNSLAPPTLDPSMSISRQQALNLARGSFQGRVLSVRMDGSNWRVRIDQNGTVFNVFVDGRTGEVSRFPD